MLYYGILCIKWSKKMSIRISNDCFLSLKARNKYACVGKYLKRDASFYILGKDMKKRIVYQFNHREGQLTEVLRNNVKMPLEKAQNIITRFKKFCLEHGISVENIVKGHDISVA